jgi:hypothetical protein
MPPMNSKHQRRLEPWFAYPKKLRGIRAVSAASVKKM